MKTIRTYFKVIFFIVIIGFVQSLPSDFVYAQGGDPDSEPIPRPNIKILVQQADIILIGQTTSVSSHLSTNQYGDEIIVSDVNFEPEEILKGQIQPGQPIIFQDLVGGTINDVTMVSSETPLFNQDVRSLLFLEDTSSFGQDAGANEAGDRFGSALAAGDFNNDGFDELAIGAPGEDYRGSGPNAGVVFIRQFNNDFISLRTHMGVFGQDAGANESGDQFGSALVVGDFNNDGVFELAVGSPGEDFQGSGQNAGVVFLWR